MTIRYTKPERIDLRSRREYDEKWVQGIIAADPSVLGLGDVVLRDRERTQPNAGRLDLLLQDLDASRRFEVELQLGPTDESHIIRTIEYWDIERKRYPQYDHCAVLVAEQVTSRFLNVISLFNGALPLVAIQMQALAVGEHVTLVFTTVVDELVRGPVGEDEDAEAAPADRAYWEKQSSVVSLVDRLVNVIHEIDESVELNYTRYYIGLAKGGRPFNFVKFIPRRHHTILQLPVPKTDELDNKIDSAAIDTLNYHPRLGSYRLRLTEADLDSNSDILRDLMEEAHSKHTGS